MIGTSLVTKTKSIQRGLEQIVPQQLDFGRPQAEIRSSTAALEELD
jgi:hypothetical protein